MTFALAAPARDALLASDARIVVTGAGGWLGMATLDLLAGALGPDYADRVHAFGSATRLLRLRDGMVVRQHALDRLGTLSPAPTWVLHHAFLTKERAGEGDYVAANRALAARVLGALDAIGATGVFVPSSGAAAAGADAGTAMQLYGALKREDETAFAGWAARTGATAVIARIYALAAPYMNKPEHYALAQFLRDAAAGGPIRIQAVRPTYRGFVAAADLASLALCLLADGPGVARFDAVATPPLEMAEIARTAAESLGTPCVVVRPPVTGDPQVYAGDPARFLALCTRFGMVPTPLVEAIRHSGAPGIKLAA